MHNSRDGTAQDTEGLVVDGIPADKAVANQVGKGAFDGRLAPKGKFIDPAIADFFAAFVKSAQEGFLDPDDLKRRPFVFDIPPLDAQTCFLHQVVQLLERNRFVEPHKDCQRKNDLQGLLVGE